MRNISFLRQLSGYGDNLRQLSFFIFKSMVQQVTKTVKIRNHLILTEYHRTDFYTALKKAGFQRQRKQHGRFIKGLQLKADTNEFLI